MNTKSKSPKTAPAPAKFPSAHARQPASKASKSVTPKTVPLTKPLEDRIAPVSVKASRKPAPKQHATTVEPLLVAVPTSPTAPSKQAQLIELLLSPEGGTIEQMIALTGWQAHTIRGTLSGALRKRLGLDVQSSKPEGATCRVYRIGEAASK